MDAFDSDGPDTAQVKVEQLRLLGTGPQPQPDELVSRLDVHLDVVASTSGPERDRCVGPQLSPVVLVTSLTSVSRVPIDGSVSNTQIKSS